MAKLKIALDAGHGFNTSGKRTPDGEREWSFNDKVLRYAQAELLKYEVEILRLDDPTGKTDVSLKARTDKANAWKADVLVSIHQNANTGKWGSWGGTETYIAPNASAKSKELANAVQKELVAALGLRNRGVKSSNLHMVRESKMPAILTEGAFMDSTTDIATLRSEAKLKAQGVAIARGIIAVYKPKLKPTTTPKPTPAPSTGTKYRVVVGTFGNRDNANAQVAKLKAKGFDSFLAAYEGKFRVVAGTFANRENAIAQQTKLKKAGFDSFLLAI